MNRSAAALCFVLVAGLGSKANPVFGQELPPPSPATDSPISTDRPGNGNAATTVPKWRLQIETSAAYAYDKTSSSDGHAVTFPTALRFGVLDFLELRVGSGVVGIDASAQSADIATPTDTSVGAKLQVLWNAGWRPNLSVMVDVFFPSGRGQFTGGIVAPDARVAASWVLPQGFGVLLNAGADILQSTKGTYARLVHIANLNYAPPIIDGRITFFVESFGRIPVTAGGSRVIQIDLGATFLIEADWQVDVFTQHALTDDSPDLQVSIGLSARF